MKVRKLAVALALAGGLGSGMAQALGLGEIEMQSWLNEPLDAEITLRQSRGVDPGDVFVNVAPEDAYQRVGLERHQFLGKLKFEVVTGPDGNLVINVSSREAFREPYLNFLLELTWPNGRLMREYAVLVDPPVYAEESGIREQVSAPSSAASRPQSTTSGSSRSAESVRRQAAAEGSLSRSSRAGDFGPTGPSDTLWTIAQQMRPDNSVSMQQVMLAIQDQNPDAFIGGNINRLKRGQVLRAPTLDQIRNRSQAEATRVVARQNQEFQTPRTVDATRTAETAAPASQPQSAVGDELRLIAADDSESRTAEQGGSAGGDGDVAGGVDAGSAVAMEELEATRRENEELNSRLEDMQSQVETLQRLLELKNSQLADMQGMTSEDVAAEDAATAEGVEQPEVEEGETAEGESVQSVAGESADEAAGDVGQLSGATDEQAPEDMAAGDAAEQSGDSELSGEPAGEVVADGEATETDAAAQDGSSVVDAEAPEVAGTESTAATEAEPVKPKSQQQQPAAAPEKGLFGKVMDAIVSNPLYQIALGGGLVVLLLLLLLVARRNANREKAFYDQLNAGDGDEKDSFDLTLDDESEAEAAGDADVIAEAETYIAYGRHDQAAQVLETAISREPSRTDLRLKLLEVYADNQDRAAFEKQYGEVEALDDETALQQADSLKERLEEAEAMPSIDDLESQLRSDSFGGVAAGAYNQQDEVASEEEAEVRDDSASDEDWVLSDELKEDEFEASKDDVLENEFGELESNVTEETSSREDLIEYDLSGISKADSDADDAEDTLGEETDFSSLEMDLESESAETKSDDALGEEDLSLDFEIEEPKESADLSEDDLDLDLDLGESLESELESEPEPESELNLETELESIADLESTEEKDEEALSLDDDQLDTDLESGIDGLDESFLDELDAELEKAEEESDSADLDLNESSLDDLELDVSDEDLALMEEFSEVDKAAEPEESGASLDEELGLEDAFEDLEADADASDDEANVPSLEPEEPSDPVTESGARPSTALDIDDSDLGDDDDFDFLAGTDEAATKLDLARAYIEMGDSDGARDILEEVALEGNDEQKTEAQELLKNLS